MNIDKKSTTEWQRKLDDKMITLLDPSARLRAPAWKAFKRFTNIPQAQVLPPLHSEVKDFAVCVACDKVVWYCGAPSNLAHHVHSTVGNKIELQSLSL